MVAPPSNVPGLHLGEMSLESRPRDETDVFFDALHTALLKERARFLAEFEWPRTTLRRNVTRVTATSRDGRVFAPLHNFLTNRRVVGTASLKERVRNEGAGLLYCHRYRRALNAGRTAPIGRHSSLALIGHQTLELLRSDWLNLEPLALDNPISKAINYFTAHARPDHDGINGEAMRRLVRPQSLFRGIT